MATACYNRRRQWQPTPVLLPGESRGQRSLVGCSPWDRGESDMTEWLHFPLSCIGEGNGNPLQCSCLENPRDGGAWWAAINGVARSRTRLKRLSSSRSSPLLQQKPGDRSYGFASVAEDSMGPGVRNRCWVSKQLCLPHQHPSPLIVAVQPLGGAGLFMSPWTAAWQASLSLAISWSLPRLKSIESVMPSSHPVPSRTVIGLNFYFIQFDSHWPIQKHFNSDLIV